MTKKRNRSRVPVDAPATRPGTIELGASCTLHEAAALRADCLAALEAGVPPVLDGSRVERLDTAGLQVLVGFTIDCMERSLDFTWAGRSEALVGGIRRLGLEALLESPGLAAVPTEGAA